MKARFKNEVVGRFANHGIELLGVFESPTDASRLTYLTRFKSEADRTEAWAAFGADPEWLGGTAPAGSNGPPLKNRRGSAGAAAGGARPLTELRTPARVG